MDSVSETTMHGWGWSGGVFGLVPVLILLALVPLANLVALWVLAFKRWPVLGEEDRRP